MESIGDRLGGGAGTGNGKPADGVSSKPVILPGFATPEPEPDRTDVQEILASMAAQRGVVLLRESEARLVVCYVQELEQRVGR